MSLSSQGIAAHPDHPGKIKHLFLRAASPPRAQEYAPYLYMEAKIDFSDVRSGYHMTCGINNTLELLPFDDDLLWTRDMVRDVDPATLQAAKPDGARLRDLPRFVTEALLSRVETQYLKYLLRHAEVRVFRNFALNMYSIPGETKSEFQLRCLEVFKESFRRELDTLREVVNRRLERIEQRYIGTGSVGAFESDGRMAQAKSGFHVATERIAELFLQTELTVEPADARRCFQSDSVRPDLEEALAALETDVRQDIRRLLNSYQEKLQNIDEYIVHPGLRDLHLVRVCILWVPVEATKP